MRERYGVVRTSAVAAILAGAASAVALGGAPVSSVGAQTLTPRDFTMAGSQSFTVPTGVCGYGIVTVGASGGASYSGQSGGSGA